MIKAPTQASTSSAAIPASSLMINFRMGTVTPG
jgi:hypothetical protein